MEWWVELTVLFRVFSFSLKLLIVVSEKRNLLTNLHLRMNSWILIFLLLCLNLSKIYNFRLSYFFLFQLPRLYNIYKEMGIVTSFQNILDNFFLPLFEVTVDPQSHPQLHVFLKQVLDFHIYTFLIWSSMTLCYICIDVQVQLIPEPGSWLQRLLN